MGDKQVHKQLVFDQCRFAVVRSKNLRDEDAKQVRKAVHVPEL